jgi:hypothetical protein
MIRNRFHAFNALLLSIALMLTAGIAAGQEFSSIDAKEIMAKADSVGAYQDSIFSETKYKFREMTIFNELEKDGRIKKSDTSIAVVTMQGSKEIEREQVYASGKKGNKKEEKKNGGGEASVGISFDELDSLVDYTVIEVTDSTYVLSANPNTNPPEKGAIKGTMVVDKSSYSFRRMAFDIPKPEGPLKEFYMEMDFKPLEGGLVVPYAMKMKGFAKAMLGIVKIRFSMEMQSSEFELIE